MNIKINERQLNKYFEIDDSNKMMADFIITYISEHSLSRSVNSSSKFRTKSN